MADEVELSVIVVNYNTAPFLSRCLRSIDTYLKAIRHEVCVVDNASSDGSLEMLKKHFPQVQVVANKINLGFAAGVNQGLEKSCGRFILWLNPDTELLDGKMTELIKYFAQEPTIGIVGPQTVDLDGSIQFSCRSFPSFEAAFFNRYSLLTKCFPSNRHSQRYLLSHWDHKTIREVDWVSGACFLHRRKVLDEIGLLDERFFMYCEDVDFCFRAKQAGWKVVYHPGCRALHRIGESSRFYSKRMIIERHRSIWHYYTKHFKRSSLKDLLIRMGVALRCALLLMLPSRRESRAKA